MADNTELQTSRLVLSGAGSYVDNDIKDFEAAIRKIFKITADSDLSACASIGAGPDMTMAGTLTLAGDPTEGLHACTKQYIDNTGGGGGATRCAVKLNATQTVTAGSTDPIAWDDVHIETAGNSWDGGEPTRIVAPVDGDYFFCGVVIGKSVAAFADFHVKIRLNDSQWLYDFIQLGRTEIDAAEDAGAPFAFMEPMIAGDFIEIGIYAFDNDQVISVGTRASMVLLG